MFFFAHSIHFLFDQFCQFCGVKLSKPRQQTGYPPPRLGLQITSEAATPKKSKEEPPPSLKSDANKQTNTDDTDDNIAALLVTPVSPPLNNTEKAFLENVWLKLPVEFQTSAGEYSFYERGEFGNLKDIKSKMKMKKPKRELLRAYIDATKLDANSTGK